MIRLFVFDMDGTALPYGETAVSPKILASLRALSDNGVRLAVASGRSCESLRILLRPLERPVYWIAHDGAVACVDGRVVYRRPIGGESVRAFCLRPENRTRTLLLYGESTTYIRRGDGDSLALADVHAPVTEFRNAYAIREPVYKLAAYGEAAGKRGPADPALRRTWRVDAAEEYVCAYANKGAALSDLQMRLPVSVFDTVAAGDGKADLPLFARAALSFAPGDALEEVKAAATRTGAFDAFLDDLVKTTQKQF